MDAALNNFVALHYSNRHMSWLHCMWGVGATVGPYIMGYALSGGPGMAVGIPGDRADPDRAYGGLIFSLPLWKKMGRSISLPGRWRWIPFRCRRARCFGFRGPGKLRLLFRLLRAGTDGGALGQQLSGASWKHVRGPGGRLCRFVYLGITVGRALNGFLAIRYEDDTLIRMGEGILAVGVLLLLIPGGMVASGSRSDPGGT